MKYLKIIYIFLLICIEVKSQNSHKAIYNIYYKNNDSISKIDESKLDSGKLQALLKMRKSYEESLSYAKMVDFNLDYNQESAIFYLPEQLEIEKGRLKILKRLGRFNGKYYTNNKKTIHEKNSFGQDFLVDIPKFEWIITSISKNIGSYKCFKATTTKIAEGSRGIFEQKIIAWFAPEIPFNFGPKEYNGLPGLIIQLEEGNISYILKKINVIEKTIIEKPGKGKKITQQEFDKISKNMMQSSKKRF
ncbi:MAG: GLPGLI family protein [Lutibacter sp.]|nr:GLPGLI family protein [Lutibacter sp.]